MVLSRLRDLKRGRLELIEGDKRFVGGSAVDETSATIRVLHPRFYLRAIRGGSLGLAEAYLDGDWTSDNVTAVLRLFLQNLSWSEEVERQRSWTSALWSRLTHFQRRNTVGLSRRNIQEHYDLGNEFFRLFLDDTMTYSCGIFERPDSTMRDASVAKIDRACRKLQLTPDDHLLEIGTGWGACAIHAAREFGCRVTTTTISEQQFAVARERIAAAGLSDRIQLVLEDYRHLQGQYSKLISIEMIEAVGHEFLPTYFRKCYELLQPTGMMLLQGIVMCEQGYSQYLRTVDFIQKHVFPGGCLTSVGAITDAVRRSTDMRMLHLEDLAPHYARTLANWREQFLRRLSDVKALGYSDRFVRMWNYYLCYCQAAFDERYIGTVQMLLARSESRHDPLAASLPGVVTP